MVHKRSSETPMKKWRARNPEKVKAHRIVFIAVRNGTLSKFDCFCGQKKVEAHHEDYSKPLEVIWLCKKHHNELDKARRNGSYPQVLSRCTIQKIIRSYTSDMPKKVKPTKQVTEKQFGLRANKIVIKMIEDIMRAEGHNSWAGAIIQCIRDKHQHLVEIGSVERSNGIPN